MKNQFARRKPGDRGTDPGQQAADHADGDDERQEQQEHRLQADVGAQRHERRREQRQAGDGQGPSRRSAARGGRDDRQGTRRRAGIPSSGGEGSWEMTWTSMGPERRTTRLTTEPCSSSSQRERRLAPSTSCVQFSARAKSVSAAATSVATTLVVPAAEIREELPVAVEVRAARSREAVGPAHVQTR
ncbi:MAG: hypothetical protein KatS3mg009_2759 [Acidimicrobiia bacterium]|nr:MAG: hypothetical protein KatS3mg009_2759 [Acidimicrobiia bacterium]